MIRRARNCGMEGAWTRMRSGGLPAAYMAKKRVKSTSSASISMPGFDSLNEAKSLSTSNSPPLFITVTFPWGGAAVGTAVGAGALVAGTEVAGAAVGAEVVAGAQAASSEPAPKAPESLSISRRVRRVDEALRTSVMGSSLSLINGTWFWRMELTEQLLNEWVKRLA